jgi:heterodisulfide reductase subunit C2
MPKEDTFKREVLRLAGPEVRTCLQCGTCSASCPTAHLMDRSTRELIKLVLEDRKEEALSSDSIWLCTSCQLCTVRCPRGIRPKAVVGALKEIYEREGRKSKDQAYEDLFLRQVRERGRVSETELSGEYVLANPKSAVQAMEMGIALAPKGKVKIGREVVKRPLEVKRIFQELGKS